jgi:hypothetical protein
MCQNSYSTQDDLCDDAEQLCKSQPEQLLLIGILPAPTKNAYDGGHDREDEDKGEQAIAKFNPGM